MIEGAHSNANTWMFLHFEQTQYVYTILDNFVPLETKAVKVESLKASEKTAEVEVRVNL